MDIKRAQCSRRGYRTHLNKLLVSVNELLHSPDALCEDKIAKDYYDQLQRKERLITALEAKIKSRVQSVAVQDTPVPPPLMSTMRTELHVYPSWNYHNSVATHFSGRPSGTPLRLQYIPTDH